MPVALRYRNRFRPDDDFEPERLADMLNVWLKRIRQDGTHTATFTDGPQTDEATVDTEWLTSDTADWTIAGLRNAKVVRIGTEQTTNFPCIDGIVPVRDGQVIYLVNESGNNVLLRHLSSDATPECQILVPGQTATSFSTADTTMPGYSTIRLWYDASVDRWRIMERS